jgi:hypothetical protein
VLGEPLRSVLIHRFNLARSLEAPPHVGAARLAFHVHQATELAWAAGLAAMAILVFSRRRWPVALIALVWASAVAYLVTGYPAVRGDELRLVYLAAELAALTVAAGVMILWTWQRAKPTPAGLCVLIVCMTDGVTLFAGAWRWGFWVHWDLQQVAFALTYLVLTAFHVIVCKLLFSGSSPR